MPKLFGRFPLAFGEDGLGVMNSLRGTRSRWTPVIMNVDADIASLWIFYRSADQYLVAYSAQDGWNRQFTNSTVVETGGGLVITVIPSGGWNRTEFELIVVLADDLNTQASAPTGRWTPFRADLVLDESLWVIVKIGSTWNVVMDDDSFSPQYARMSSLQGSLLTLLPNGGWVGREISVITLSGTEI